MHECFLPTYTLRSDCGRPSQTHWRTGSKTLGWSTSLKRESFIIFILHIQTLKCINILLNCSYYKCINSSRSDLQSCLVSKCFLVFRHNSLHKHFMVIFIFEFFFSCRLIIFKHMIYCTEAHSCHIREKQIVLW